MNEEWTLLISDTDAIRINLLHARLESEGIKSIVLNKQDSSYAFGSVELYVRKEEFIKARFIMDDLGS
jgi:hypothetical protein